MPIPLLKIGVDFSRSIMHQKPKFVKNITQFSKHKPTKNNNLIAKERSSSFRGNLLLGHSEPEKVGK